MKLKKINLIIIFILIILCIFGISFANYITAVNSEDEKHIKINYISEESSILVSLQTTVNDTEIGNGRAWISNLDDVKAVNSNFIAPANKEFIGWQYKSSTINGSVVTSTSAYTTGDHFTQDEYYSLSENESEINLVAVWGYKVYVDAVNGIDDNDGLSNTKPVRTMGRAYELLARLDSGNQNANITGFSIIGDSTTGYSFGADDTANLVKDFDGKIIVMNNINYSDTYEGRYKYITYGDLINHPNYNASTGKLTYNDGVANRSIAGINAIAGYTANDPVKFTKSGTTFTARSKTYSGSTVHFLLQKVVNSYSYVVNGTTYYTYGRLTQYTEHLRAHVGRGIMTPENNGLVMITSKDGNANYKSNATFEFGIYTRYASGGDLIYKDMNLAFYNVTSEDKESTGYVGGYAANGNYLVIDENVTVIDDSKHNYMNIYGGGHSYRYNSRTFTGADGNGLGNPGSSTLSNTRLTVKSGTWSGAYSGCYGQKVGRTIGTYGTTENNSSVVNIYGGTYTLGIGMGHEGASSINSYVYVYGGTMATVHGSGLGSTGSMADGGKTNILITGETTKVNGTVYGGSSNGTHIGDINLVIKNGTITSTIYGGSNSRNVTGDISITIAGGSVRSIIGGCTTGSIDGTITLNISGGTITGDIYTSGQGGTQEENTNYYQGAADATGTSAQILDTNDPRLNVLITGDSSVDAAVIKSSATAVNSSATQHHNDNKYTLNGVEYYYPQIYSKDYSNLLTGYTRGTYGNHGVTQYTITRKTSFLSLATVEGVDLNITGGTIKGNIFGGGKVAVVEGNVNIDIANATITGNIYGGGDGSMEPTVNLYTATSNNTVKTEKFTWKGSDTFNIEEYDQIKNIPIDVTNKYIYSPTYDYMGGVNGNVSINISGGTTITGNVYGGGNEGLVTGTVDVNIDNGVISQSLYGGGNIGHVTSDIKLNLTEAKINSLFGGGKEGRAEGSTELILNECEIDEVFGGGYAGRVFGNTSLTINSGTYRNVFGGCDQSFIIGSTLVKVGNDENLPISISGVLYGGGRGVDSDSDGDASDFCTVEGKSDVTIKGMSTYVYNYGSTKLGSVAGDVNVTFDTYRKENSTNPYVTMNGIDRATTVSLINSYIALENIGENGEKEGIKNIGNLNVPAGSGLKVTATGEITGDFNGGGTFYLDSKVSLTIGGDITGITTLAINPQIATQEDNIETPLVIKGTKVYAYMIVKGNSTQGNLVCVDSRYADEIRYAYESNTGYYYLESDIGITEQISEILVSKSDINYTEDCSSWGNVQNVIVQQDDVVTTNILLNYNFSVDNDDAIGYKNISRSISIKESTINGVVKYFPSGTIITMIADGEYYKYTLKEDMEKVFLADFVKMEDSSVKYFEIKNVKEDENTIVEGKTTNSTIYSRTEEFRFVIDFAYAGQPLPVNTYIIYLNLSNNNVESEAESLLAENIIDLKKVRNYKIVLNTENREYIENDIISVNTNIWIDEIQPYETNKFLSTPLYSRITVRDSGDNIIALPDGTIFKLGNKEFTVENGVARINMIDSLTESAYDENMTITVDMSRVQDYSLKSDIYVILFEEYLKDAHAEKIVSSEKLRFNVVRPEGATIVVNLDSEKLSVTTGSNKELKVNYYGDVYNPNLKIKLQKANNSVYEDTNYAICTPTELQENTLNSIILNFEDVPSGNYRLCFEVYGYNSKLYSTSAMNVEVK